MISPELLRRYPFFSFLDSGQLREVVMITEELECEEGETLFKMGTRARALYFLLSGSLELHYTVVDENNPGLRKDFIVGNINPGEIAGISSVIEPYELTASALAIENCKLLSIDAVELRALFERDKRLACGFMRQVAQATMQRLHVTRVLLAAASTPL